MFTLIKSAWAWYFGGWDYRKHQCTGQRKVKGGYVCCTRLRGHLGKCNHDRYRE